MSCHCWIYKLRTVLQVDGSLPPIYKIAPCGSHFKVSRSDVWDCDEVFGEEPLQ